MIRAVFFSWGCSEFLHMSCEINLDVTMQLFIERGYLHAPDMEKFNKIESARDNYFRNKIEDYGVWLCNSAWHVLPTIFFKDGTPLLLTCKHHENALIIFKFTAVDATQISHLQFQINFVMLLLNQGL